MDVEIEKSEKYLELKERLHEYHEAKLRGASDNEVKIRLEACERITQDVE